MSEDPNAAAIRQATWNEWLEAIGFAPGFPILGRLDRPAPEHDEQGRSISTEDSKKWFLNRRHLTELEAISQSLGRSRAITTRTGHGASSIARYLYQKVESQTIIRNTIPVLVSLEDALERPYAMLIDEADRVIESTRLANPSYALPRPEVDLLRRRGLSEEEVDALRDAADRRAAEVFRGVDAVTFRTKIENAIYSAVVRSLATNHWERVMSRSRYRELLDAESPRDEDLDARRVVLSRVVPPPGASPDLLAQYAPGGPKSGQLKSIAPRLVPDDIGDLVAELSDANVRILLMLDLSATPLGRFYLGEEEGEYLTRPYEAAIKNVAKAIKNIEEDGGRRPAPTLPSLLNKAYFISADAWPTYEEAYARQDEPPILFPPIGPVDLFAMLSHHYPMHQEETGRRAEVLAAILDSSFLQINDRRAISTDISLLRVELAQRIYLDNTYQQREFRSTRQIMSYLMLAMIEAFGEADPTGGPQQIARRFEEMRKEIEGTAPEGDRDFGETGDDGAAR